MMRETISCIGAQSASSGGENEGKLVYSEQVKRFSSLLCVEMVTGICKHSPFLHSSSPPIAPPIVPPIAPPIAPPLPLLPSLLLFFLLSSLECWKRKAARLLLTMPSHIALEVT